ncbi:MAG TPA: hypothetical protein VFO29_10910 [Candidatus Rubrimentiphilum sp.]|nr:hypothetical protein [Candidatus Rubrimentiphilum sp.]
MSVSRALWFSWATALTVALFLTQTPSTGYAKARLVAVVILRSTPSLRASAIKATRALAARIAQQDGWDAQVIDPHWRQAADAAAAVGAEIYIIGQYTGGSTGHVVGAAIRVATDERLSEFSYVSPAPSIIPSSVSFAQLTGNGLVASPTAKATPSAMALSVPSGELISVAILSDIGSRTSQEGDTFGVITTEDYYYKGYLILPKGSPGYGVITHLKRAGSFHSGGELNFTVKRLVTPSRTDLLVETNGATADADKQTERNGNTFGQYLLWGVGMFAQRGNDILIKKGTTFHVSTLENATVPIAQTNALPAQLDPVVQLNATGQLPVPQGAAEPQLATQPVPLPTPQPASPPAIPSATLQSQDVTVASVQTGGSSLFQVPNSWIRQKRDYGSDGMATLGFWVPPGANAGGEWLSVASQTVPTGLTPDQFAAITQQNLQRAIGDQNVRVFRTEKICNGSQNGWYAESVTYVGPRRVVTEQTIGLWGSDSYVATYSRPEGSAENPAAHQALESLCALPKS